MNMDALLNPTVSPANKSSSAPARRTILIIDDTEDWRSLIAESLTLCGYRALTAAEGLTGLRMAEEHRPDLVICDVHMPKLDGYGTLQALREQETTAGIPFIFLSGATEKGDVRRGMELGADDYLTKPFTQKELNAAIQTRFEKQAKWQSQSDRKFEELRENLTLTLPHELRTPLSGILGVAGLMIDDYANMPPEDVLESARFIQLAASRLHRLIENFLLYSQIELMADGAKRIGGHGSAAPVMVQEVVTEVARRLATRHKREGDLLLKLEPAGLLIPAENLAKIVEELVDNAFKFSEPGRPVRVAATVADNTLRLCVTDQGRGLTSEQIHRIGPHRQFDRKVFEQQGAGLGLVIAKRLTEWLGGQFSVVSTPGQETVVQAAFALPGI